MVPWRVVITDWLKSTFNTDHIWAIEDIHGVTHQVCIIYASSHNPDMLSAAIALAIENPSLIVVFVAGDDSLVINFNCTTEEDDFSTYEITQRKDVVKFLQAVYTSIGIPVEICIAEAECRNVSYKTRPKSGYSFSGNGLTIQSSGSLTTTTGNGIVNIGAKIHRIRHGEISAEQANRELGFLSKSVIHEHVYTSTFLKQFFTYKVCDNDGFVRVNTLPIPGMVWLKLGKIFTHPVELYQRLFKKKVSYCDALRYCASMVSIPLGTLPGNIPLISSYARLLVRCSNSIPTSIRDTQHLSVIVESEHNPLFRDAVKRGTKPPLVHEELDQVYTFLHLRYGLFQDEVLEFDQMIDNLPPVLPLIISHPVLDKLSADY
jgi:hypothetical protein